MSQNIIYWEKHTSWPIHDVAIIGSGIVGLTTAIFLKTLRPDLQVAIIEKGKNPVGASIQNAGFACFGSPTELLSDLNVMDKSEVIDLIRLRYLGLHALFSLVNKEQMDFNSTESYELFDHAQEQEWNRAMERLTELNGIVAEATGLKNIFVPCDDQINSMGLHRVSHLICNRWEGTLHPGKMMAALVRQALQSGIAIYWEHEMAGMERTGDKTVLQIAGKSPFHTRYVLLATNGFAAEYFPELDVYPVRNQVMVTAPLPGLKMRGAFHMHSGYVYFRNIQNRVLIGGARHLDLKGSKTGVSGEITEITRYLTDLLEKTIAPGQEVKIEYSWNGFLGVGGSKKPIIKMVADQIGVAVRLGGMGVAIGTLVGKDAANMLVNRMDNARFS